MTAAIGSSSSPRRKTNDAAQDARLVRGEPDAVRVLHQPPHPLDEPLEVVVEVLHLLGAQLQHRIGPLADLRERHPAADLALAVELLVVDLAVVVVVVLVAHGRQCRQRRHRPCGSTSTTTLRPALRIAGAAAARARPARAASAPGRSVLATSCAR